MGEKGGKEEKEGGEEVDELNTNLEDPAWVYIPWNERKSCEESKLILERHPANERGGGEVEEVREEERGGRERLSALEGGTRETSERSSKEATRLLSFREFRAKKKTCVGKRWVRRTRYAGFGRSSVRKGKSSEKERELPPSPLCFLTLSPSVSPNHSIRSDDSRFHQFINISPSFLSYESDRASQKRWSALKPKKRKRKVSFGNSRSISLRLSTTSEERKIHSLRWQTC